MPYRPVDRKRRGDRVNRKDQRRPSFRERHEASMFARGRQGADPSSFRARLLAKRRHRLSHAKVRSTTQRRGRATSAGHRNA